MIDRKQLQETYYQAQTLTNHRETNEKVELLGGMFLYTAWLVDATLKAPEFDHSTTLDSYAVVAEMVDDLNDETRAATIAALRTIADALEAREVE